MWEKRDINPPCESFVNNLCATGINGQEIPRGTEVSYLTEAIFNREKYGVWSMEHQCL